MVSNEEITHRCDFCSRTNLEVSKIIASENGSCICNKCVDVCQNLIGRPESEISNAAKSKYAWKQFKFEVTEWAKEKLGRKVQFSEALRLKVLNETKAE